MFRSHRLILLFLLFTTTHGFADGVLYRYEGNVLPYDPSAGWLIADACSPPCSESMSNGHFINLWTQADDITNYHYWIAQPGTPPTSLWVEWRFHSNHPLGPIFFDCDGSFTVDYKNMHDRINMYGDATISGGGDFLVTGLDINAFHTYRFETLDGSNFFFSVDGTIFYTRTLNSTDNGAHYLQFHGFGGCSGDWIPNMVNEWDYVRYGTLASGEKIVSTDPPSGHVGPAAYTTFTTFRVKFDAANYLYINDITVQSPGGDPIVTATRRREQDDVDTVEIVLDRPLPPNERTVFIFQDGPMTQAIEYDFRPLSTIPALSHWGAVALTLSILTIATILLRR